MRERNFGKVSVIMDAFSTRSKEGKLDPRAAEDAIGYETIRTLLFTNRLVAFTIASS